MHLLLAVATALLAAGPAAAATPSMFLPNAELVEPGAVRVDLPMVIVNRVEAGVAPGVALGVTTSLPFFAATKATRGFALPSLRAAARLDDTVAVGLEVLGGVGYLGPEVYPTGGAATVLTFADDLEDVEAGSVTVGLAVLRFPERWRVRTAIGGGVGGMWEGRRNRARVWEVWYANLDRPSHIWGGMVGPRWRWDTKQGSWAFDTALAVAGSDELAPLIPLPWLSASYRWRPKR